MLFSIKKEKILKSAIILFSLILWFVPCGLSQNLFPEDDFVYDRDDVARIDISILPGYLELILASDMLFSDVEYPASFKMTRGNQVRTENNVGFRLRGNTSRYSGKKSFKISFNSFNPGRSFEGIEKMNLNGEHNDPSIARARICWDLFRSIGVPAPRSSHVELYINGEYKGLYLNVEHIDENFTRLRFGNNDGNLYKCLYPADLVYRGADPDNYKFEHDGRRVYELKRNEIRDDYSDLAHLIDIINNEDPDDFREKLEPIFNVNSYLKNLVIEVLAGHWDAYSMNKNNFYLYHNEESGKFEFIPYDTDNTFGIDWFGTDWAKRDIYNWSNLQEKRPLTKSLLENQIYRDRYSFYMKRFIDRYFSGDSLNPEIDRIRELIAPYAVYDLYRSYDYGYTWEDFWNSFDSPVRAHVKDGIKPFIATRRETALGQLELTDIPPVISRVHTNKPRTGEELIITSLVEDEEVPGSVSLYYSTGDEFERVEMISTGNEQYRIELPAWSSATRLRFYIEAGDRLNQVSREPFTGWFNLDITNSLPGFQSPSFSLEVYPNPFSDWIEVMVPNYTGGIWYSITNLSGQLIMQGESEEGKIRIHPGEGLLSEGIYILYVECRDPEGKTISGAYKKIVYQ